MGINCFAKTLLLRYLCVFKKKVNFTRSCALAQKVKFYALQMLKNKISRILQGRPQDLGGGGQEFFFPDLGICMSRSDMLRMAKSCALLGGFGGMLPRENFLKRCNLVRFRVYFDQILSLFFSKNAIFYIKNKYFRYTFVMGYFS